MFPKKYRLVTEKRGHPGTVSEDGTGNPASVYSIFIIYQSICFFVFFHLYIFVHLTTTFNRQRKNKSQETKREPVV